MLTTDMTQSAFRMASLLFNYFVTSRTWFCSECQTHCEIRVSGSPEDLSLHHESTCSHFDEQVEKLKREAIEEACR